jgi:serine/threonine protein kinase
MTIWGKVMAVGYLHETKDVAHGDLKPDNAILSYGDTDSGGGPALKLIDFGRSIFFSNLDQALTHPPIRATVQGYNAPNFACPDPDVALSFDEYKVSRLR